MRLISEIDAGGDFRGLIEKELKLRLDLPVAGPVAGDRRGRGERERAGRRPRGQPAPPARPKTTRTRSSANHAAESSRPAADRGAAAGGAGRGRATHDEGRAAAGMPDLSQIVGRPLPDRGMPTGTVSVRVARKMPANAVAGVRGQRHHQERGRRSPPPRPEDRRQRARAVRGDGAGRRVPRRGERRRRAPADRDVHDALGGRHPHDADLRASRAAGAPPPRNRRARPPPAKRRRRARARTSAPSPWARPPASRRRTRRCPSGRWRSACATRRTRRSPTTPCCWAS